MADKKQIINFSGKKLHAPEYSAQADKERHGSFPPKVPMAEMIKKYRKEAKISQQALADALGVTRNTVINWESGKYRPDADLFPPLCGLLGITLNDLFGIEPGPADGYSVHERNLIQSYRLISPVSQRIVDRMVDSILEEEIRQNNKILEENAHVVAVISTAAAAGDGFNYSDIPVEDYRFVFLNGRNEAADAIIRVKGDSMLPVYKEDDWVYVQYSPTAGIGEDVICYSRAGMHIKRLGEDGPYSLNKDCPFKLTNEDDRVQVIGRVLGIVNDSDYPSDSENMILEDLRKDEIREFRQTHNLN